MDIIVIFETENRGSEEHSFVIGMGSDKQDVVLLGWTIFPVVHVNDEYRDEVEHD